MCPNCNSFPLEDYVWWVSGEKTTKWWCATCGEKYDCRQPNKLLVVQTGERFEQAKVFKAHAVPQGLCANLINAQKLVANQQEDGDDLLQNIVTNLGKGSRKGLTDGLREFIKVDNERGLDVGALRRGTGTFKVRKPKAPEGVLGCDSQGEPRLVDIEGGRSEYLEGSDGCRVDHIEPERWGPPLVDADWYAFCQALYKGMEGEDREEMYDSYKVMTRAVGEKKPQKAKVLWAMKAAKDRTEEFYDPAREEDTSKRNGTATGVVGRTSQGSNCRAGDSIKVR